MQNEFREGDWVRHRSYSEPLRVIGLGSTIAVRFPKGEMRAFEPCELEKVAIPTKAPVRNGQAHEHREEPRHGFVEHYVLVAIVSLLYLSMLVWWLIAGGAR